jgi:hypothetical protein
MDLVAGANRQRGRPPTGLAKTTAQRQKDRRDRLREAGTGTITLHLPLEVIEAIHNFLKYKDETQDQLVERLLRSQLMRKR